MRFPKMRPRVASELKIPDLAGGLNLRDGLSEVLDNQLTDCKNMWWNDGVLKTRPGMKATNDTVRHIGEPATQTVNIRNFPEIKYVKSNETYFLQATQYALDKIYGHYGITLEFAWQNQNNKILLPSIILEHNSDTIDYFMCCKKNILYCFMSNQTIYTLDITDKDSRWHSVHPKDYYVPTVYTHCTASVFSGTQFEGFNLIGDKFKMIYSTVNPNITPFTVDGSSSSEPKERHNMYYPFPNGLITNPEQYIGKEIKAIITNEKGEKETHTAVFTENSTSEGNVCIEGWETKPVNGRLMKISDEGILFWWGLSPTDGKPAVIYETDTYIEDNLEIIMPYIPTAEEKAKIFNMTRCEWFGGASAGISGGTRLFLCGNKDENEKALVCWSGLDNPLYFSENACFYVGDTTNAVTGFGKQSDKLVIFKENETYYTYYQQNNNIDAKSLINQSILDYTASSVYFPLVQINSNIGCAYPDTIQLCRNRLVWLGNNGNVYTLVSESQYNERSIFCVSEMIKNRLKEYCGFNRPTACDWKGYYCLCFGNEMYLMDYNCYGYTHIASYSKTEDANIRIPWYCWEFEVSGIVCMVDDKMIFSYYLNLENYNIYAIINNVLVAENESKDSICYEAQSKEEFLFTEQSITSKAVTKLFDFGLSNYRKNVDKINLQLGNNGGEAIKVKIITECGEEEQEIILTGNETQGYTPGFIDSKAIFPCIRQTVKIGLELSSTGVLVIDGMNFKYRITGGTR